MYLDIPRFIDCQFDIVFVVDGSESITHLYFKIVLHFISSLIGLLAVVNNVELPRSPQAREQVRVGMVVFSRSTTTLFGVGAYTDRADAQYKFVRIERRLNCLILFVGFYRTLGAVYPNSSTNMGEGIEKGWALMRDSIANDPRDYNQLSITKTELGRIIFLFTDGLPSRGLDQNQITSMVNLMKNAQFSGDQNNLSVANPSPLTYKLDFYTVFVLSQITQGDVNEFSNFMRGLATQTPSVDRWSVQSTDFTKLAEVVPNIQNNICGTLSPTKFPTGLPSPSPTRQPTKQPSKSPTKSPTASPTKRPTGDPTRTPTQSPTKSPYVTSP